MPTEYGPVSVRIQRQTTANSLSVQFTSRFRQAPKTVWLHVPPVEGVTQVIFNGRAWAASSQPIRIEEPGNT
jgi:hypothetical protein